MFQRPRRGQVSRAADKVDTLIPRMRLSHSAMTSYNPNCGDSQSNSIQGDRVLSSLPGYCGLRWGELAAWRWTARHAPLRSRELLSTNCASNRRCRRLPKSYSPPRTPRPCETAIVDAAASMPPREINKRWIVLQRWTKYHV
jgi:hypothetical protein